MKNFIKYFTRGFLIVAAGIIISAGFGACGTTQNEAVSQANSSPTPASAVGAQAGDNKNTGQDAINAEKENLQQERAKLEKEKQNLKDEKARMEKMKDAAPPASEVTNNVTTLDPPSNIRDSPNGKILCTVKKQATWLKIYGSTGISDDNGEWFYTKHCGKLGVIHSSQFVSPG